jgi:hypothetical protein
MTDQETRKRLIINRHIFKTGPEEIARRFALKAVPTIRVSAAAAEKAS